MTVVSVGRVTAVPDQLTVSANSCQEGLVEPGSWREGCNDTGASV